MLRLTDELRVLIESGPLAHLSTINPDGSPQVTVIWIGLDGDQLLSGHMRHHRKLQNIERDPRVVLSFDAPRDHSVVMNPYVVLRAHAIVEPSDGPGTCSTGSPRPTCRRTRSSPHRRDPATSSATRSSGSAGSGRGSQAKREPHRVPDDDECRAARSGQQSPAAL